MLKPGRTFVPNFQHRVLLGTATFVGMLLLVGWVAVNEPARMQVFTDQYHGRSIENGATTFLNNCATCHGVDGKGITSKAPALNNPMLFLKDNPAKVASAKVNDLKTQIATAQGDIVQYNKNVADFEQANAALQKNPNDAKLKTQVTSLAAQITNFDLAKAQQQVDDLTRQYNQAQNDLTLLLKQGWDPDRDTRLNELKWTGTLHDYIYSTVSSGRPVSATYWGQAMPTWAQANGGPLRPDEVEDVTQYVMNFQDTTLALTPSDVNQQFKVPVEGNGAPQVKINASGKAVGMDADTKALAANGGLSGGDPAAGQAKYNTLPCAGCHLQGQTGPATAGTYTRIVNIRLKDNPGRWASPEEFMANKIVHPGDYTVPGFAAGVMEQNFGSLLDLQDLKDLIAFLDTQK